MPSRSFPHFPRRMVKKKYSGANTSIWGLQATETPNKMAEGTNRSLSNSSTEASTMAVQKESTWPHWEEFK